MKRLKKLILPIFTILFLTSFSLPKVAQAEQNSIRSFSWEGLSLSQSPAELQSALERDGYTQLRVTEGKKKVFIYQKKSKATNNKVQFTEKDGVLTKFSFSETRIGGKKNKLNNQETDATYVRIKSELGIEDSTCKPGIKSGGTCNGQPTSATYTNGYNVNVTPKATKIVLSSNPLSQAVIESNKETTDGLASAYACLGTTDITSVKDIYECMNSVSEELDVLDKAKKINRLRHMPVYLESTTTPCWQLVNFYKRGLSFSQNDSDNAPLPSCATFAAVIKRAAGSPAFWFGCMNENESDEFLKKCIDSVKPAYFKLVNQRIPTCKDYQQAYQSGIVASKDALINVSTVPLPECEHVLAFAKSLRKPLAEKLLACAGYDPDKAGEHILKCITSDEELWTLSNCVHVQASYRIKLMVSNYGYVPDAYRPIACEETKGLLAKADSVRLRLEEKAEEERRQAKLRREDEKYMKEYMKEKIAKEMNERYGDSPEKAATRTSKLEKEIKANGGDIKLACKALGRNNIYCPPTLEEIRLAMIRNHSKKLKFKMINGHMIHGDLNTRARDMVPASAIMVGVSLPGLEYFGVELLYGEPRLLRDCASRNTSTYNCFFELDLRDYKDKRTIQESGYTASVSKQLRFISRYDYSYYFSIGKDGLWHAERTETQIEKDQVMIKKNQERMDYEEKVFQEDIQKTNKYIEGLR